MGEGGDGGGERQYIRHAILPVVCPIEHTHTHWTHQRNRNVTTNPLVRERHFHRADHSRISNRYRNASRNGDRHAASRGHREALKQEQEQRRELGLLSRWPTILETENRLRIE